MSGLKNAVKNSPIVQLDTTPTQSLTHLQNGEWKSGWRTFGRKRMANIHIAKCRSVEWSCLELLLFEINYLLFLSICITANACDRDKLSPGGVFRCFKTSQKWRAQVSGRAPANFVDNTQFGHSTLKKRKGNWVELTLQRLLGPKWQWYISKEKKQLTTSEQTIFHFNFLWRAERLIL